MTPMLASACHDFPEAAPVIREEWRHNPETMEFAWNAYRRADRYTTFGGRLFVAAKQFTRRT